MGEGVLISTHMTSQQLQTEKSVRGDTEAVSMEIFAELADNSQASPFSSALFI